MDLPAGIRRTCLGRRPENGEANHSRYRAPGFRHAPFSDSFRPGRQKVGSFCGVGFGRKWRVHAACPFEIAARGLAQRPAAQYRRVVTLSRRTVLTALSAATAAQAQRPRVPNWKPRLGAFATYSEANLDFLKAEGFTSVQLR